MYPITPLNSRLSRQFFLIILGIIIAIFAMIYVYSVPLIKQKVFEIERNASRLALNNVFEIASRMYSNVEDYRTQALAAHQQQLKVAVSLTESYLRTTLDTAQLKGIPLAEARAQAFEVVRHFSYGNQDYIWIADYTGKLLSHPDPRFHDKNALDMRDEANNPVINTIVKRILREGEGFYRYPWKRLSQTETLDKVSYVKNYPEWGFVIGSGVYLDDLEKEVGQRKELALNELRPALLQIKLAKTGYLYVFDSQQQMLIHPNANIDGTRFQNLKNPLTQNSIAADLIKVADTGKELHYLWDKPSDPGHYVYEKLSLVRYLPGFDWYICSSVYLDELRSSSEMLSNRLMILATLTLFGATLLAFYFTRRITRPLEQLADTARKVSLGDLSAKSGIHRHDELGLLATSFDGMVERLKTNIDSLDTQVKQRTDELLETNARAQRMHAAGQLAGGLAHDFNNLLSIIMGNLLLARDRYHNTTGLNELLAPAIRASKRGADITHRLLAFSRRESLRPEVVNVRQLVQETVTLLHGSLPDTLELNYAPDDTSDTEDDLWVSIDPSHLENALVNLALNARDAMPRGGKLLFETYASHRTGAADEPSDYDEYDEPVQPGNYVTIRVTDTGNGFSETDRQLAFEPFYSTKSGEIHSGLGLSMVYGFVKQSNGYIRIHSRSGQGAAITLLLPAAPPDKELGRRSPQDSQTSHDLSQLQGKLLLLVEDNPDVRQVVREQLIRLGINVLEAEDGDEALQLMASLPALDGMVSDIMLPGAQNGQQLAEQFYREHPLSVILLISGYSYDASPTTTDGTRFPLLRKPFTEDDLRQALWQALPGERTEEK